MLFNIACPLSFSCLMRCVIWMLHSCSKYHMPIFQRCVYLQTPLWILVFERRETGTKLSRAQQSTEVTKWIDVNSSDGERSLSSDRNHIHNPTTEAGQPHRFRCACVPVNSLSKGLLWLSGHRPAREGGQQLCYSAEGFGEYDSAPSQQVWRPAMPLAPHSSPSWAAALQHRASPRSQYVLPGQFSVHFTEPTASTARLKSKRQHTLQVNVLTQQ